MPLIVKKTEGFTPPPDGVHYGVCVDVTPVETYTSPFGEQDKFRIVWELEAKMEDGRPFLASKFYTPSLHKKANLRKDLETWRSRPFTEDELKGFDVEKVLGVSSQLVITHQTTSGGDIRANVTAVLPAKGHNVTASGKYERVKDRKDYKPKENPKPEEDRRFDPPPVDANEDIPF